jgi:hypothetical protein
LAPEAPSIDVPGDPSRPPRAGVLARRDAGTVAEAAPATEAARDRVDEELAARAQSAGLPPPRADPPNPDRAYVDRECRDEYADCVRHGVRDCDEQLRICPEIR